jgi:hypothetical protein
VPGRRGVKFRDVRRISVNSKDIIEGTKFAFNVPMRAQLFLRGKTKDTVSSVASFTSWKILMKVNAVAVGNWNATTIDGEENNMIVRILLTRMLNRLLRPVLLLVIMTILIKRASS